MVEAFLAVAQHPCVVVLELMLKRFANHAVCAEQVGSGYAFAVGRIGNHYRLVLRLLEVFEVGHFHADVLSQSGCAHVEAGRLYGLGVYVIAVYVVRELAFLRVVVVYAVEEVGVEVGPLLERIALAEHARSHVAGDERGLDKQRARAAHGVDEVRIALPSRHEYHARGEHLVERSLDRLLPVAAAVQAFAA